MLVIEPPQFRNRVRDLETALLTQDKPGDRGSWLARLVRACSRLEPVLYSEIETAHRQRLNDLKALDPALATSVRRLRDADLAIMRQFRALKKKIRGIKKGASFSDADGSDFRQTLNDLRKMGHDLVVQIRTQERDLKTWFAETQDHVFADPC